MKPKKRPRLKCAWALLCCVAALPLLLLYAVLLLPYFIFKYLAKLVVILIEIFFYVFGPKAKPDESLSNPLSNLIEHIINYDL